MLDLDPNMRASETSARAAFELLMGQHAEPQEVVIRQHCVLEARIMQAKECQQTPPVSGLNMGSMSCLVAGGAGGLGGEVVKFLVQQGASSITVLGRTAPHSQGEMPAEIKYQSVDISDATAMKELKQKIGPHAGIFNLAGVLSDAWLADLNWDKFAAPLKPKVYGTQHLHDFAAEDAKTFVLFSSMASLFPFPGQINHSAANAFEDASAHERTLAGRPSLSINWGLWMDVGSAKRALELGRRQGIRAMGNQEVPWMFNVSRVVGDFRGPLCAQTDWDVGSGKLQECCAVCLAALHPLQHVSRRIALEPKPSPCFNNWALLIVLLVDLSRAFSQALRLWHLCGKFLECVGVWG